ncbi:MAG: lipopolysaccharide biosynthesis protein [Pseudomonadota bacterium]
MPASLSGIRRRVAALARDDLARRLARGGAAALVIKLGAAGLSFLMFLLLARALGAEEFGRFGFAFSLATSLSVVGSFGQRMLVLRYAPAYHAEGDAARLTGVLRHGYAAVTLGGLAMAGGLAAAALLLPGLADRAHLLAAAALILALGLAEYQARALRAVAGMVLSLAPRDIFWRLAVILAAGAWLQAGARPPTAAEALGLVAGLLIGVTLVQAALHPLTRPRSLLLSPARHERREWMRAARGLWGVSVAQLAGPNLAIVLGGLLLAPSETAMLFAALRVAMLLDLVTLAAQMVGAPLISQRWHARDTAGLQRICRLIALATSGPALAAFALFLVAGDWLMALFGPEFAEAGWLLVALSLGYLSRTLFGPAAMIMQMAGRERALLRIAATCNALAMAAVAALAVLTGPLGAALAAAGGMVGWTVLAHLDVKRRLGVDSSLFGALRRPSPGENPG